MSQLSKSQPLLDRRSLFHWSDWMLRHAPEVLLRAAGLPSESDWFSHRMIFLGKQSIQYWSELIPDLREIRDHVSYIAQKRHGKLSMLDREIAISELQCMGSFAANAYLQGKGLVPGEMTDLSMQISGAAASAWWASNRWKTPGNCCEVLRVLNEPLHSTQFLKRRNMEALGI
ncbi:hypothetical protein [Psychromicrobium sp. YIM B11713]|uniref:hypothetical protein n=1 Tax=Psychromicrobium sp. YIM B11713 TaxID=3145233 RepID=UPI00374EF155